MSEINEKVASIVAEKLGVKAADITDDTSFIGDLGADSLDVVEIIMSLEEEFGMTIPDDTADKLITVGDVIRFIEANKK